MCSPVARLAAELKRALRADGVRAACLFGSAVRSENPRDVDLLVVYGRPLTPVTAPDLEPAIRDAVALACGLPVHLVPFSEAEAREPGLIDGLKPLRVLFE